MTPDRQVSALIPPEAGALAQKRIYFGHQSVGYNLVEGLQAWAKEKPDLGLKFVEGRDPGTLDGAVFMHARNGENHEPFKKIQDFAQTIEGGVGAKVDIAFFKFCYVDFTEETDVDKIFAEYKATMARLHEKFPKVKFVHFTVPLTIVETGAKASFKRLLGRKLWGADVNVVRSRYNALVRREYAGREPLFDLAAVESTRAGGTAVTFEQGGSSYQALAAEYSLDGKHLNPDGARWASAHLLQTLAALR